jgi:hypothetical protein
MIERNPANLSISGFRLSHQGTGIDLIEKFRKSARNIPRVLVLVDTGLKI